MDDELEPMRIVRPDHPRGPKDPDKKYRVSLVRLYEKRAAAYRPLFREEPVNLFNTED